MQVTVKIGALASHFLFQTKLVEWQYAAAADKQAVINVIKHNLTLALLKKDEKTIGFFQAMLKEYEDVNTRHLLLLDRAAPLYPVIKASTVRSGIEILTKLGSRGYRTLLSFLKDHNVEYTVTKVDLTPSG